MGVWEVHNIVSWDWQYSVKYFPIISHIQSWTHEHQQSSCSHMKRERDRERCGWNDATPFWELWIVWCARAHNHWNANSFLVEILFVLQMDVVIHSFNWYAKKKMWCVEPTIGITNSFTMSVLRIGVNIIWSMMILMCVLFISSNFVLPKLDLWPSS